MASTTRFGDVASRADIAAVDRDGGLFAIPPKEPWKLRGVTRPSRLVAGATAVLEGTRGMVSP